MGDEDTRVVERESATMLAVLTVSANPLLSKWSSDLLTLWNVKYRCDHGFVIVSTGL